MLYGKAKSLSEIHTKCLNALCKHNIEFLNVKPGRTYSNDLAVTVKELVTVIQFTRVSYVQSHFPSDFTFI